MSVEMSQMWRAWPVVMVLVLGGSATEALAQEDPLHLRLGPLAAAVDLADGWRVLRDAELQEIQEWSDLESGGPTQVEFALSGPGGALIFATYVEYRKLTISVQEVAETPLPKALLARWGVKSEQVHDRLIRFDSGLEAAEMRIDSLGSGRDFLAGRTIQTTAVWLYLPSVYREASSAKSTMSALYFRAPTAVANSGSLEFFYSLAESFKVRAEIEFLSAADFSAQSSGTKTEKVAEAQPAVEQETEAQGRAVDVLRAPLQKRVPPAESLESPAVDDLNRWTVAVDAGSVASQLAALQSLAAFLPANTYLAEKAAYLERVVEERRRIEQFLGKDPGGERAAALAQLHRAILAKEKSLGGRKRARAYLGYLDLVWPDNPL